MLQLKGSTPWNLFWYILVYYREDFSDFAEICFWEFGDRVKLWITLNEPWSFSVSGYALGTFAPGRGPTQDDHVTKAVHRHRCNVQDPVICSDGNPGTEPYIVAHHLILAHAVAVDIYKKLFQVVVFIFCKQFFSLLRFCNSLCKYICSETSRGQDRSHKCHRMVWATQ